MRNASIRMRRWLAGLCLLAAMAPLHAEPVPIAVIVAAEHAREAIDPDALTLIYRRKRLHWADGSRIEPINLPADHPLRLRFSHTVLGLKPEQMQDYWNEMYFQGVSPPYVLASEAAMLAFVAATANAIGYVSACHVAGDVSVLFLLDERGRRLPFVTVPPCADSAP
ncbi:MAG: hypothetical protein K0U79_14270 [Gammaproteobacteria bacterium]|nr:hypothetical protein [Gammaproteobacteria bacterium]